MNYLQMTNRIDFAIAQIDESLKSIDNGTYFPLAEAALLFGSLECARDSLCAARLSAMGLLKADTCKLGDSANGSSQMRPSEKRSAAGPIAAST